MSQSLWGRAALAGGTDWPVLGRGSRNTNKNPEREDQLGPKILRTTADVKFKRVISSHSACHAVFIDINDRAWLVGRNDHGQLGTKHTVVWEPVQLTDTQYYPNIPDSLRNAKIVNAACGRSHTLLITDSGEVYASGANTLGACGQAQLGDVWQFTKVGGYLANEQAVQASAGVNFSIVLTQSGRVYAFGSPEKGQLGHGRTGEYLKNSKTNYEETPEPLLVAGELANKKIVAIASGQQHSLAMDDEGYVYSWGSGSLGRLGHGKQEDCLLPKVLEVFTHQNRVLRATKITCGGTNSMVVDGQGMVYLFGKFKLTGDGSSGQPWMWPKPIPELTQYKARHLAAGGVTVFVVTIDEGKPLTIAVGQNATHGELGLGFGHAKSATKPESVEGLENVEVLDISGGQNTTWFVLRPPQPGKSATASESASAVPAPSFDSGWASFNPPPPAEAAIQSATNGSQPVIADAASKTLEDAWTALGRFPPVLEAEEDCFICHQDKGEEVIILECDKCDRGYHLTCVTPPLADVPDDEWFCPLCLDGQPLPKTAIAPEEEEEPPEESEDEGSPPPQKSPAKRGRGKADDDEDEAYEVSSGDEAIPEAKRRR